jgi:hypothetical protein
MASQDWKAVFGMKHSMSRKLSFLKAFVKIFNINNATLSRK